MVRCGPSKGVCVPKAGGPREPSLARLVAHYVETVRPRRASEHAYYAGLTTLADAVRIAVSCRAPDGKRHPHQRRIARATLAEASRRIARRDLSRIQSFGVLHETISTACADVAGFGVLTRYDIACRIGAWLRLEPECVYLHAGTRAGAKALRLAHRNLSLDSADLPRELRRLAPGEVEDFLCIYKEVLAGTQR